MAQVKKKKRKGRLITIIFSEILIIALLFVGFKVYSMMGKIQHVDSNDKNIQKNEDVKIGGYRTIALFGGDSRSNTLQKGTHSDTIIIASINNKTKDVKLSSVYRDTYVNIPGEGYDKINAAYFKGGYALALSTLNKNFDLDIKEYVTVNFQAVVKVIDLLGGITLDIQENERHYLNGYVKELNRINGTNVKGLTSSGTQLVNGTQATAYARIRYTAGGDFKRTERQRIVVQKIFEKVKHSDLATIQKVMNEVFPNISTNLSSTELLGLASDVLSYDIVDQTGFPFEKDAHTYHKVSYVFPIDLDANVSKLHEFLFNETGYVPTQTVKDTSTYVDNIRVQ